MNSRIFYQPPQVHFLFPIFKLVQIHTNKTRARCVSCVRICDIPLLTILLFLVFQHFLLFICLVLRQGQKYLTLDNNCHQSSEFAVEKDVEATPDAEHSKKGEKEKQCEEEDSNEYNRPAQNMKSEIYVIAQDSNRRNSTSSSEDLSARERPMSPTEDSTGQHSQQGVPTEPSKTLSGK